MNAPLKIGLWIVGMIMALAIIYVVDPVSHPLFFLFVSAIIMVVSVVIAVFGLIQSDTAADSNPAWMISVGTIGLMVAFAGFMCAFDGVDIHIGTRNGERTETRTVTTSPGATYVSHSASCSERTIVVSSTTSGSGAGGGWTTPIDAGGSAQWSFTMDDSFKSHVWVRVDGGEPKPAATESPPIVGQSVSLQNRGNDAATVVVNCTPR